MKTKYLTFIPLLALAAACNREPVAPESHVGTASLFTASFGEDVSTRTSLDGTKISWSPDDEISILWDGGSASSTAATAGATTTFSAEVESASAYYGIYPSSLSATLSGEQIALTVPSAQHGVFGEANLALAYTSAADMEFSFKNICALGRVVLNRSDIAEVRIASNGGDKIAGNITVTLDEEGLPTADASAATGTEIVLTPSSGSAFAPGSLYFSVIPAKLQSGVIFRLKTSGGESLGVKTSYQAAAFERSKVLYFGTIDGEAPAVEGYSMPIGIIMKPTAEQLNTPGNTVGMMEANSAIANAAQNGNRLTFTGGASIEKTGDPVDMRIYYPSHSNPKNDYAGFQLGLLSPKWTGGDAWLLKVPMKEALSGDLRLFYGSRREANRGGTSYFWSSDLGVTWHAVTGEAVNGVSDAVWKSVDFTIPAADAVPAGGQFWFRIVYAGDLDAKSPLTGGACFANGFVILPQTAELSSVPAAGTDVDGAVVLFSEGFDELVGTRCGYIDFDGYFFRTLTTGKSAAPSYSSDNLTLPEGVSATNCQSRPGFLQVGYADEALASSSGNYKIGSYAIDLSSRIIAQGWTAANLTITLKAGGITTAYFEPVDARPVLSASSGTLADGTLANLPMDAWGNYTFTVSNLSAASAVLTLTSTVETYGVCGVPDNRFFIDDIVITATEGEGGELPVQYEDKTLVFDLTTCSESLTTVLAGITKGTPSGGDFTMTADDNNEYGWYLYYGDGTSGRPSHNGSYLVINAGTYLGTPVIEGARLKSLTFTQSASASTKRKAAITSATHDGTVQTSYYDASVEADGKSIVAGGKNTAYTFTIKNPAVGTRYYLVCGAAGLGVSNITLVYSVPKTE